MKQGASTGAKLRSGFPWAVSTILKNSSWLTDATGPGHSEEHRAAGAGPSGPATCPLDVQAPEDVTADDTGSSRVPWAGPAAPLGGEGPAGGLR